MPFLSRAVSVVIALFVLAGPSAAVPDDAFPSRVTHVTDGDTAYLKNLDYGKTAASWPGRSARFIGVDTPEVYTSPAECYGEEASAFTKAKLEGRKIKVAYGEDPEDPYDRALVYIWRAGKLFNATLVRRGFARVLIYEPNDRYEKRLRRLQRDAREADRGLWAACD